MESIGARIARARGSRSKAEVARELKVDVKTVYRWEHDSASPEAESIAPLADTLGVSLRWLLTGEGEGPPEPAAESVADLAPTDSDDAAA